MQKNDVIIYEYNDNYFIIQRSKQEKRFSESISENVALAAELSKYVDKDFLGQETLIAIDNFGMVDPTYKPWELKELRKQLCDWTGARSYTALLKNSRIVLVYKDFDECEIKVIPFDNHNIKPWESMIDNEIISLPIDADKNSVGKAIDASFTKSTYHPERKNQ